MLEEGPDGPRKLISDVTLVRSSEGLRGTAGCAGPPAAAQPAVQLPKIVRFYPEAETH